MNKLSGTLGRLVWQRASNPGVISNDLTRSFHFGQSSGMPSTVRVTKGQEVKWCACGFSNKQPLCDGSHAKKGSMTPMSFTAKETKEYIFCTCKQSKNKPFCDGTHAKL